MNSGWIIRLIVFLNTHILALVMNVFSIVCAYSAQLLVPFPGSTMDSEWITGRIVFLNTHILALMMNVFYSAFIVSSLLSRPAKTIKNTRNIIDSQLHFGVEDLEYLRGYFKVCYPNFISVPTVTMLLTEANRSQNSIPKGKTTKNSIQNPDKLVNRTI